MIACRMAYKYDLIIYDNDGTLVDTELPVNQAFLDTLHKYSDEYRKFDVPYILRECIGTTPRAIFDRMAEDVRSPLSDNLIEEVLQEYQLIVPDYYKSHIIPDPEQIEILTLFSQKFKQCVASNGFINNVISSLKTGNLSPIFGQYVYTAESVKNPKPAPDLILYAAEQMGVTDMSRVLHIEDAPRGAQAGIAAGATVVGYIAHTHDKKKAASDLQAVGVTAVFDNWKDFRDFALS